jgi:hypothetical protein
VPAKVAEPAEAAGERPAPTVAPTLAPTLAVAPDAGEDDEAADEAEPLAPVDTPGARLEQEAARAAPPAPVPGKAASPAAPTAKQVLRLIDSGRPEAIEEAIRTLYMVRRQRPRDAAVALLLGHAYFHKKWRTDGLREYARAIELRPGFRHDRQLLRNTVVAIDDPTYRLARAVITRRIGPAAVGELRAATRPGHSPKVQRRAAQLVAQLTSWHRRRR